MPTRFTIQVGQISNKSVPRFTLGICFDDISIPEVLHSFFGTNFLKNTRFAFCKSEISGVFIYIGFTIIPFNYASAANSAMKECNQCGKCCIQYSDGGLSATAEEIDNWEAFNPAISEYVMDGKIWMDPVSGTQLTRCPWLEELPEKLGTGAITYGCRIYQDRPEDCRQYPTSISEMVRDGCEMIEVQDLDSPKRAQISLDLLMADSRPPLS